MDYARKWAYNRNPAYYDFTYLGGDCTNFVSQCLYAGGIPMNFLPYGWYYENLNSRSPSWTGVDEFWNFGISNDGWGLKLVLCEKKDVEIADVVQLFNGERYYHTLIITAIKQINGIKTVDVAAHDNDAFDRPLSSYGFSSVRFAKAGD